MSGIDILEVRESILNNNDELAAQIRRRMDKEQTFLVNIMGSPGAGKTTLLKAAVEYLKNDHRLGVIEADVDSDVDAREISKSGVRVIQLHTGGLCHLDAKMTGEGLTALGTADLDIVFVENIGHLVCPAEFDIGAALQVIILSIPEGDDKPLKYPLMFETGDCILVNKTDASGVFDFDMDIFKKNVSALNPNAEIMAVSALKGEGIDAWIEYLKARIKEWKKH